MENLTNWCVYMHENRFNGKKYIGITSQKPTNRWKNGEGYKQSSRFYSAIQHYGWDGFRHEILFTSLSQEDAESLEIELIAKYQTLDPDRGYNLDPGGGVRHPTEETRRKLSEINTGRKMAQSTKDKIGNAHRGMKRSETTRSRISAALTGKKKSPEAVAHMQASAKGKVISPEQRERIRKANSKAVQCVETGVVYESATAAGFATGVCSTSISECRNGIRRSAGGYHWRYAAEAVTVDG